MCDGIVKFRIDNPIECLEDKGDYWLHSNKIKAKVTLIEWVHPKNFDLMAEMAKPIDETED